MLKTSFDIPIFRGGLIHRQSPAPRKYAHQAPKKEAVAPWHQWNRAGPRGGKAGFLGGSPRPWLSIQTWLKFGWFGAPIWTPPFVDELSIYLSFYLPIYPSIYLSICLSLYSLEVPFNHLAPGLEGGAVLPPCPGCESSTKMDGLYWKRPSFEMDDDCGSPFLGPPSYHPCLAPWHQPSSYWGPTWKFMIWVCLEMVYTPKVLLRNKKWW